MQIFSGRRPSGWLWLPLLGLACPARGYDSAPPKHFWVYVLAGGGGADFRALNQTLKNTPVAYPLLRQNTRQLGVGLGLGPGAAGRFTFGTELRSFFNDAEDATTKAQSRVRGFVWGLLPSYRLPLGKRLTVMGLAGTELTHLTLELRQPVPANGNPVSVVGYLSQGPDRTDLTQLSLRATVALQLDWKIRAAPTEGAGATLGVRLQAAQPLTYARWRTESDLQLSAQTLSRNPTVNPSQWSLSVVYAGWWSSLRS